MKVPPLATRERKKGLGDSPITRNGYFLVTPALEAALEQKYGEEWPYRFSEYKKHDGDVWLGLRYYHADGLLTGERTLRSSPGVSASRRK